jgi:hypothetical protein
MSGMTTKIGETIQSKKPLVSREGKVIAFQLSDWKSPRRHLESVLCGDKTINSKCQKRKTIEFNFDGFYKDLFY